MLPNSTERVRKCLQVRKNGETLVVGAIAKGEESCGRNELGHESGMAANSWEEIAAVRVGFGSDSIIGTLDPISVRYSNLTMQSSAAIAT